MPAPAEVFGQQWLVGWQHAGAVARGALEWFALCSDPKQLRSVWLAAMTETMDRYMRSPAFLELMRYNLAALSRPPALSAPEMLTIESKGES